MKALKLGVAAISLVASGQAFADTYKVVAKPVPEYSMSSSSVNFVNNRVGQSGVALKNVKPLFGDIVTFDVNAPSAEQALENMKRTGAFSDVAIDIRIQAPTEPPRRVLATSGDGTFPNDPYFNEQLSYFGEPGKTYRANTYYTGHSIVPLMQESYDGDEVRIGIIDGGFARIDDINWADEGHFDFIDNDLDPFHDIENFPECENSHGVGVAGAAAAIMNDGKGIVGSVGKAKVFAARALQCGGGYLSDAAYAIAALSGEQVEFAEGDPEASLPALDEPVDIINMSLTGLMDSPIDCPFYLDEAIRLASDKGVLLFASAGNSSAELGEIEGTKKAMPAMCGDVVNVAATGIDEDQADFTNYGDVDLAFRGYDVAAPAIFDGVAEIGYWEGTSFSSPLIAGVGGIIKQKYPDTNYKMFMEAVELSAEPYSADSLCVTNGDVCGAGFINVKALDEALSFLNDDIALKPILDGDSVCDASFLEKYIDIEYPICEHYRLDISEYAFRDEQQVFVYQIEKGIDTSVVAISEFEHKAFSSEDALLLRVQSDQYDYYYQSCEADVQCGDDVKPLVASPPSSECH